MPAKSRLYRQAARTRNRQIHDADGETVRDMIKIKSLCLMTAAAVSLASFALTDPAEAAREKFDRTKPHTNAGSAIGAAAQPDRPGKPGRPDRPGRPGKSSKPGKPGKPGQPDKPVSAQPQVLSNLVFHMPHPAGPLPGAPNTGYCGKQAGGSSGVAGEVVLGVRNAGFNPVPQFFVSVTMKGANNTTSTINKPVGPLGPGAVATATFPLNKAAWQMGLAPFKMKIDTGNHVEEGIGEANNQLEYACVEPAG